MKRVLSSLLCIAVFITAFSFPAFADGGFSCPSCRGTVTKKSLTLIGEHSDFYKCDTCGKWAYVDSLGSLELFSIGDSSILDSADSSALLSYTFNNGKLLKGSSRGGGVGRHPSGYADDTGTPSVSPTGAYTISAPLRLYPTRINTTSGSDYIPSLSLIDNYSVTKGNIAVIGSTSGIKVTNGGSYDAYVIFGGGYRVSVPAAGYLSVSSGTRAYTDMGGYLYSSNDAKELWSITHPYMSSIKGVVGSSVSKDSTYFINFKIWLSLLVR